MMRDPDNTIGALIRLAGERDVPSPAATERARLAAEAAWRAGLRAPPVETASRSPGWRAWAIAAGVIALAMTGAWQLRQSAPVPVARVVAVSGEVELAGETRARTLSDAAVMAGDTLTTTIGRAALAFGSVSLRADRNSRLRFDAADRVTLLEGRLYVDSGGVNALAPLRIETPAGEVRHLGTQFQVTVQGALTRIQVREGRVALDGSAKREVAAGEKLELRGTDAVLTRAEATHGTDWEWVSQTAPAFDIENRLLPEFLAWIAREHGWQLRYADAATQARLQQVRLHGSLAGLDAAGMMERIALITGTTLTLRDGVLTIGGAAP